MKNKVNKIYPLNSFITVGELNIALHKIKKKSNLCNETILKLGEISINLANILFCIYLYFK